MAATDSSAVFSVVRMTSYGGDGAGQRHAIVVVVLLDGGGEKAAETYSVAAHQDVTGRSVRVLDLRVEVDGVPGVELEDVADLNAPLADHAVAAVGT